MMKLQMLCGIVPKNREFYRPDVFHQSDVYATGSQSGGKV